MPLKDKEQLKKSYFQSMSIGPKSQSEMDLFEHQFHLAMQNPINGIVKFENVSRRLLHNRLMLDLSDYFSINGEHLFGQHIEKICFSGTYLGGYNRGWESTSNGTEYLSYLIVKNPPIKKLDLSNTQLGGYFEAQILIKALKKNTHLIELNLNGNNINKDFLDQVNQIMMRNQKIAEDVNLEANQKMSLVGLCFNSIFKAIPPILETSDLAKPPTNSI